MNRPNYYTPVSIKESNITGKFWSSYMNLIRTSAIPYQWEALNDRIPDAPPSYSMYNFRVATGKIPGTHRGSVFQDSDIAKWIEAVAYTLMWHPDKNLEKLADSAINEIIAIQQPDGYLNTYYILNGLEKRFTNLRDNHELYCLGHFLEGAVAYYDATGKDKLLNAVIKYADLVDRTFGPEEYKLHGYPGHEEIELALVKLYQITKNKRHLRLAKYFIDQRGQQPLYFTEEQKKNRTKSPWEDEEFSERYYQTHAPVRQQHMAAGHAVRAVYLYTGMAEVARETDDPTLAVACQRLWNDITQRQMYITGGIGAASYGESFTFDYDLPNDTIYSETCASIGLVFFARSMQRFRPQGEYADVIEKALYNGILSGIANDGKSFFYVNPLEVDPESAEKDHLKKHIKIRRQKWFGCACCPTNLVRLFSSLNGYLYAKRDNALFIHQYAESSMATVLDNGNISLEVKTNYPWEENISITVKEAPSTEATIALRIPGWCKEHSLVVDGEVIRTSAKDGYVYISKVFSQDSSIQLTLKMPVTLMQSNPHVRENMGNLSVMRGPVVYCLEEADNGENLNQISIGPNTSFNFRYDQNFFGGAVVIKSEGKRIETRNWDSRLLYRPMKEHTYKSVPLTWIPYYLWANRSAGEMTVWVNSQL